MGLISLLKSSNPPVMPWSSPTVAGPPTPISGLAQLIYWSAATNP